MTRDLNLSKKSVEPLLQPIILIKSHGIRERDIFPYFTKAFRFDDPISTLKVK